MTVVENMRVQPHRWQLDQLFGEAFWNEVITRMVATTHNTWEQAERKFSNCLAYLLARSKMEDPNADLVANLGPDEAWHVFLVFTKEYVEFCLYIAGTYLHHDPAGEAALVNRADATRRTVELFERHGIEYDPGLWRDHELYPNGAKTIKSGFMPQLAR